MTLSALEHATSGQQKASDPQHSAWVSANAGSGKTHVLATRVIRLLLEGTKPEKILCLTFTRAAAAEMSNRIFKTLGTWVTLNDEELIEQVHSLSGHAVFAPERLAIARRLFAQALETPGGLKVQTIHAFCESLLQRFPLEADVPAGFEVVDERVGRQLLTDARASVLSAAADAGSALNVALKTVVGYLQPADFDTVLGQLLEKRRRADAPAVEDVALRLRALHDLAPDDDPGRIMESAIGHRSNDEDYRELASLLAASGKQDQDTSARIEAFVSASGHEARYLALRSVFFTKSLGPRKNVVTRGFAAKNEYLAGWLEAEQAAFEASYECYRAAVVCTGTEALLMICDAIIARHEAQKQRRSLLDYDDLINRTLELFGSSRAAWVLYKLDGGLDHILVDEAQDTSPQQWQVISNLAEEFFSGHGARDVVRTVFAVGDEKQSIFSFQGADPAQFDEMRRYFERHVGQAQSSFERVPLNVSFRSTSAVLRAVDWVFEAPEARRGLTQGGEAPVHEVKRSGQAGLVELWPTVKPEDDAETDPWDAPLDHETSDSPRTRLAEVIADRIKGWLRSGEILTAKKRPIEAGDILILVRRRNAFVDAVVRELKRRDVPVAGADRLVLTGHIAIKDLLALAQFVLLPEDDLTLATILKSPLVARTDGSAFDDDDLFALAHGRTGRLWHALLAAQSGSPDWANAVSLLTAWRSRADWQRPYEFYAGILGSGRVRQRFIERLGTEANDPIDEFMNLALHYERQNVPSLQGFMDWMSAADTDIKRDMEHGTNEVRVMTVHGAKGLEANIVILPDTCSVPDHRTDPKVLSLVDDAVVVPIWPIAKAYETQPIADAKQAYRSKQLEEYNRLLYVAMTRACDRLYVCGYETRRGRETGCWYDLAAQALTPHAKAVPGTEDGQEIWRIEDPGSGETESGHDARTARATPVVAPEWSGSAPPIVPPSARTLAPSRLDLVLDHAGKASVALQEQPVLSPLTGGNEDRFRRGRQIHALLQSLPDLSPGDRAARAADYLERTASDLEADVRREVADAVFGILDHADFGILFGPGSRAEVPLAGHIPVAHGAGESIVISGQLDRLVVTPSQVLIVDYKTNRPAPAALDGVAELYVRQLAAYRLALMALYPDRAVRAFLLWTDGPRLMEVPAASLDLALPAA